MAGGGSSLPVGIADTDADMTTPALECILRMSIRKLQILRSRLQPASEVSLLRQASAATTTDSRSNPIARSRRSVTTRGLSFGSQTSNNLLLRSLIITRIGKKARSILLHQQAQSGLVPAQPAIVLPKPVIKTETTEMTYVPDSVSVNPLGAQGSSSSVFHSCETRAPEQTSDIYSKRNYSIYMNDICLESKRRKLDSLPSNSPVQSETYDDVDSEIVLSDHTDHTDVYDSVRHCDKRDFLGHQHISGVTHSDRAIKRHHHQSEHQSLLTCDQSRYTNMDVLNPCPDKTDNLSVRICSNCDMNCGEEKILRDTDESRNVVISRISPRLVDGVS
ncbi:uncharacterized protein DEA37_0006107 [Paragonimus westermani]|uniref:Uncharacterized protein n=1 Tax=Paragonimus westermani TaxID=34504 RepID=A0A5J4NKP5_9TREM|nr:uncharacterized protein DEA37_0006107 [Paragonimus westermani]